LLGWNKNIGNRFAKRALGFVFSLAYCNEAVEVYGMETASEEWTRSWQF